MYNVNKVWYWTMAVSFLFREEVQSKEGYGPGDQDWGFVEVRPGACMFWWLYCANPPSESLSCTNNDKPLLIRLQGGPGRSASGYGNFLEFGPLDIYNNTRNSTWMREYNVLLVDSPVGTGFGEIKDNDASLFARNNTQIAKDFMLFMETFLEKVEKFKNTPTYVVSQSYGGKMGVEIALLWHQMEKDKRIKSDFRGIILGSPVISFSDVLLSWPNHFFLNGIIDSNTRKNLYEAAKIANSAMVQQRWENVQKEYLKYLTPIFAAVEAIDFSNFLTKLEPDGSSRVNMETNLDIYLNTFVKPKLNITTEFGVNYDPVFYAVDDYMTSVIELFKKLKDETNLKIVVCTAQFDQIVAPPVVLQWVENIFQGDSNWMETDRVPLVVDNVIEGYQKTYKNFKMYWILRSGHQIPKDNPTAMAAILRDLTSS